MPLPGSIRVISAISSKLIALRISEVVIAIFTGFLVHREQSQCQHPVIDNLMGFRSVAQWN